MARAAIQAEGKRRLIGPLTAPGHHVQLIAASGKKLKVAGSRLKWKQGRVLFPMVTPGRERPSERGGLVNRMEQFYQVQGSRIRWRGRTERSLLRGLTYLVEESQLGAPRATDARIPPPRVPISWDTSRVSSQVALMRNQEL